MPKELYEEAIADVRKLKEVAENNAKKAVIDAVTPKIREFIEKQLMGVETETPVDDEDDMLLDDDPVAPVTEPGDSQEIDSVSMPDEEGKVTLDLDGLSTGEPEDEIELGLDSDGSLTASKRDALAQLEAKVKELTRNTNKLVEAFQSFRGARGFGEDVQRVVSEVRNTYGQVQDSVRSSARRSVVEERLERLYRTLNELSERRDMKNRKRIDEADVTLKLSGLPDEVELEDLGVELASDEAGEDDLDVDASDEGDDDAGEGGDDLDLDVDLDDEGDEGAEDKKDDEVVEIDESALRRELSRMQKIRESDEGTKPQSWGHGAGDVSDDFEDEDLGDPLEDVKLNEADDEDDESCLEDASCDEKDEKMESVLRKELRFVEAAKRRLANIKARYTEAARKAKSYKEAKKRARKPAEVKEAEAAMRKANKMQKEMQESYGRTLELLRESQTRAHKLNRLVEAKRNGGLMNEGREGKAGESQKLREKLAETNLFNTKLIYTNKLLQNESLSARQKSEVVKRLDEAKSQREVKLVYEALVNSFKATTAPLRESTDRGLAGSSSRTTKPAGSSATLNEGIDTDRWGLLAGIVK